MNILVCIKQVADSETKPVITEDGKWAAYGENAAYRINRFDEHAIEEAIKIKESLPGTEVDILSVGPERVKNAIRRGLEMGADRGIHIHLEDRGYASPLLKARLITNFCASIRYDLIITGIMSEDMMSGQTGLMVAALLDYPSAAGVMKLEVNPVLMEARIERELEASAACSMKLKLPALVTVQSGINRPRYPSLSNVMKARTAVITEIKSRENINKGGYESVTRVMNTRPQRACQR